MTSLFSPNPCLLGVPNTWLVCTYMGSAPLTNLPHHHSCWIGLTLSSISALLASGSGLCLPYTPHTHYSTDANTDTHFSPSRGACQAFKALLPSFHGEKPQGSVCLASQPPVPVSNVLYSLHHLSRQRSYSQ